MKRFLSMLLLLISPVCALEVLVTLPPFEYFVEKIGGDLVEVGSLIPQGASPHTYEPTPREVQRAQSAELWFRIGEPIEARVIEVMRGARIINLQQGIDLIENGHCADCGAEDLHFWLSPNEARVFSGTIATALMTEMPEEREQIAANLEKLLDEMHALNDKLEAELKPCKGSTIVVSHPAFAYFCRNFDLHQLSVEAEGREPGPKQIAKLVTKAKEEGAKVVILQRGFSNKGANRIAQILELPTCTVDPLSPNPVETMEALARCVCPPPSS